LYATLALPVAIIVGGELIPIVEAAVPILAADYSFATSLASSYLETIAVNGASRWMGQQLLRHGLRYVAPGSIGMKALVEVHWAIVRYGPAALTVGAYKLGEKIYQDMLGGPGLKEGYIETNKMVIKL
jgi:hypothetical protein